MILSFFDQPPGIACLVLSLTLVICTSSGSSFFHQVAVGAAAVTEEPNWSDLESALSQTSGGAALHGPFSNTDKTYSPCEDLGTNAFAISQNNNGLCMHSHDCSHQFCARELFGSALPSFSVEAKVESDVVHAMKFASNNGLTVSVKTTGHSYTGSSTQAGTLLIWMQNFDKDLTIKPQYTTTCGDVHDVIALGGGAIWDDVIEAVKEDYHIVTGGGRTVSAIGGWLQGGGLSFTSRKYGIGVDQVLDMKVVLPDGNVVMASRCENPDLFWALRGGGGGTYGVVVHAHYKLYPKTQITRLSYGLNVNSIMDYVTYWEGKGGIGETVHSFFQFWIEQSPNMDVNWCGGFFGISYTELLYCGPQVDAIASSFFQEGQVWYNQLDRSAMTQWSTFIAIQEFDSWYAYRGGAAAYQNPSATDPTGTAYEGIINMSARLMPRDVLLNKPDEVKDMLLSDNVASQLGFVNYFLGGNINNVSAEDTSVHPALRKAIWSVFTNDMTAAQKIREFVPNTETGVCYNHHNAWEPDWRNACWGSHYDRLDEIKELYDPNHVLNCWHCVGYVGEEFDISHLTEDSTTTTSTGSKRIWISFGLSMMATALINFMFVELI